MEKKSKVHLTNEDLTYKFKSSFDLVNYAIKLAENMIKTGRDARVKSEVQNRAMLILEEIQEGKDQFDEIKTINSSGLQNGIDHKIAQRSIAYDEILEMRKQQAAERLEGEK